MSFIIFFLVFIFLYVFAIAPRFFFATKKKFFKAENLFAHRGLYDNETSAPENSMAAFKNAIEHGFGIEADLRFALVQKKFSACYSRPTVRAFFKNGRSLKSVYSFSFGKSAC